MLLQQEQEDPTDLTLRRCWCPEPVEGLTSNTIYSGTSFSLFTFWHCPKK
jgi:hypothetical protein